MQEAEGHGEAASAATRAAAAAEAVEAELEERLQQMKAQSQRMQVAFLLGRSVHSQITRAVTASLAWQPQSMEFGLTCNLCV